MKKLLLIFVMSFVCMTAHAYTDAQAIKSIMGEARGEGGMNKELKLKAMIMVGEGIRNRGHLKGVYG